MKKLLSLFVASLLLLVGCKGNGDNEDVWVDDEGDKPLDLFIYGQSHELGIYKKMVDSFEATTGIVVNERLVPNDGYDSTIRASIGSPNDAPDVFYANPSNIGSYANNGVIRSLDTYLEKAKEYTFEIKDKSGAVTKEEVLDYENYLDGLLDYYKYDIDKAKSQTGKTYAIPKDVSSYPLGYNKVIIEKAVANGRWKDNTKNDTFPNGLPLPWENDPRTGEQIIYTWQEFTNACHATTFPSDDGGRYVGTALIDTWAMHSWIWTAGGDWLSADGKTVTVNTPEFKAGMEEFINLLDYRGISQTREEMAAKPHYDRWMEGKVAFFNVGVWDVSAFEGVDKGKLNYGLMPTPKKDNNANWYTYIGTLGYVVSAFSKRPNAATKLALWMSISEESYNRQTKYNTIQLPNSKIWMEDYLNDATIRPDGKEVFIDVINGHGKLHPTAITYDSVWYTTFTDELGKVWKETDEATSGEMSVAQYLAYIQPKMQEQLNIALQNQADGI